MCPHGIDIAGLGGCQRAEIDNAGRDVHGVVGVVGRRIPRIVHGGSCGLADLLDEIGIGLAYGLRFGCGPGEVVGEVGMDLSKRFRQADSVFGGSIGAASANVGPVAMR